LAERGIAGDALTAPHEFYASGQTAGFAALGGAFLGRQIEKVRRMEWGVDLGKLSAVGSQPSADTF
jgi:hypothetical protein